MERIETHADYLRALENLELLMDCSDLDPRIACQLQDLLARIRDYERRQGDFTSPPPF